MPPPVVSFDLDGVIMRGPFISAVRPRIWAHLGQSAGLAHVAAEDREHHIWQAVREEHDRRLKARDYVAAWNWQAIYDQVSQAFGGQPVPDLATIVREACASDDTIGLLPGALAGLQRLKNAGLGLVATTNGYHAYQWPVLEKLGVADFFEAVITPDVAGFAKPDPRIFGSVPGLVAHVGDLLLHDVLAANLAGVQSVWLDADLPAVFSQYTPLERVTASGFAEYLQTTLETSRYRHFHPEGTLLNCTPSAVVCDVDEAARAVLASMNKWTPAPD